MKFKQARSYCYSISDQEISPDKLVGWGAINLSKLHSVNINIPEGFVISALAFDKFLEDTNIVGDLSELIAQVEFVHNKKRLENLAIKIQRLILETQIPKVIATEILQKYREISGSENNLVNVSQSAINPQLAQEKFQRNYHGYNNISGQAQLLAYVQKVWADLFSVEALEYRDGIDYEGNLSQAVLVTNQINPEISGELYDFDLQTGSVRSFCTFARLGSFHSSLDIDDQDYYLFNKNENTQLAMKHHPQKFMWVLTKKSEGEELTKVKISKIWSEKQKLSNSQLQILGKNLAKVESEFSNKFVLDWKYLGGEFIFTGISAVTSETELPIAPDVSTGKWGAGKKMFTVKLDKNSDIGVNKGGDQLSKEIQNVLDSPMPPKLLTEFSDSNISGSTLGNSLQDKMLKFIRKDSTKDVILSEDQRNQQSMQVKKMLSEIKTISAVWWWPQMSAAETAVFSNNFDGLGDFDFVEIATALAEKGESLEESKSLQGRVLKFLQNYYSSNDEKPMALMLNPDVDFEFQSKLIAQLKNLYDCHKLEIILPPVQILKKIRLNKQALASNSVQRSSSTRMWQFINQPFWLANLDAITEINLDGIVINLDQLYANSLGLRSEVVTSIPAENYDYLTDMIIKSLVNLQSQQLKIPTMLKTFDQKYLDSQRKRLIESGITGFIYTGKDIYEFKQDLEQLEAENLTKDLRQIKQRLKGL